MKHAENAQGKAVVQNHVNAAPESFRPGYQRTDKFATEDIVILFLSVILLVATVWLATQVL